MKAATAKRLSIAGLLGLVALAGCAAEEPTPPSPTASPSTPSSLTGPTTGHIHAAFKMFVPDEEGNVSEVSYAGSEFDLSTTRFVRCHLHTRDTRPFIMHIEGRLGITTAECFASWGVNITDEQVRLHATAHEGRTFANDATHAWQLWVDHCVDGPEGWTLAESMSGVQPAQHDRLLFVFAPHGSTINDVAVLAAQVPEDGEIAASARDGCPAQ